jgi:hypothetical protein
MLYDELVTADADDHPVQSPVEEEGSKEFWVFGETQIEFGLSLASKPASKPASKSAESGKSGSQQCQKEDVPKRVSSKAKEECDTNSVGGSSSLTNESVHYADLWNLGATRIGVRAGRK